MPFIVSQYPKLQHQKKRIPTWKLDPQILSLLIVSPDSVFQLSSVFSFLSDASISLWRISCVTHLVLVIWVKVKEIREQEIEDLVDTNLLEVLELIRMLQIALSAEYRIEVVDFLMMDHIAIPDLAGYRESRRYGEFTKTSVDWACYISFCHNRSRMNRPIMIVSA